MTAENENQIRGFRVGSTAELSHVVTLADVKKFADMTGDDNPLHVDPEFASRTPFKEIVVHGMLGASFISTLIGKHIPGEGALWLSQSLEFLMPVRLGDNITIRAEVIGLSLSQRLLHLKIATTNQHGQTVLSGESRVKVLEAEKKTADSPDKKTERVAMICGGSGGIGAETALLLGKQGYGVSLQYLKNESKAYAIAERVEKAGGKCTVFRGDLNRPETARLFVEHTIKHFGTLSALVYAVTDRIIYKPFLATTWEDMQSHLSIGLFGASNLIRECLPHFEKATMPSVVTLGTINTDNVPAAQLSAYTPAKAALENFTKCLAVEYGPKGIRFNVVSPGATETNLIGDLPEKARMLVKMQTPLRRLAQPEDVAHTIAFLLSPDSKHLTGETIRVCGGMVMV